MRFSGFGEGSSLDMLQTPVSTASHLHKLPVESASCVPLSSEPQQFEATYLRSSRNVRHIPWIAGWELPPSQAGFQIGPVIHFSLAGVQIKAIRPVAPVLMQKAIEVPQR